MTSIGLDHSLWATSKLLAALDDIAWVHLIPDLDDEGLELLFVALGCCLGLPLHDTPDGVVKGIEIGAPGRSH